MKRQLLIGFLMLLSCLLPCVVDLNESRVTPTRSVDMIEQSADMAIDEQAHEIRSRFFVKVPLMKRVDTKAVAVAVVMPVERHESQKQDTKTEVVYDFYAREAGGKPATAPFVPI